MLIGIDLTEPLYNLSPETFPLPMLTGRFAELKKNLHEGFGFFTICGLQPSRYTNLENNILHVGIASYFGGKRALQQNHVEQKAEALRKSRTLQHLTIR